MSELPGSTTRWRCTRCGNLTRFDVTRTAKVREYWHFDLGGDHTVEEAEVLASSVAGVVCRWCGAEDSVEIVSRPDTGGPTEDVSG